MSNRNPGVINKALYAWFCQLHQLPPGATPPPTITIDHQRSPEGQRGGWKPHTYQRGTVMDWQPIETAPKDGRAVVAVPVYHALSKEFLHWDAWTVDMDSDHLAEDVYSGWRIVDATLWTAPPSNPESQGPP